MMRNVIMMARRVPKPKTFYMAKATIWHLQQTILWWKMGTLWKIFLGEKRISYSDARKRATFSYTDHYTESQHNIFNS